MDPEATEGRTARADGRTAVQRQQGNEKRDDDVLVDGDGMEEPEPKRRQRSASKGKKAAEKDAKHPGMEPVPLAPPASKRGKAGNGEQISAFVQECFKTFAPL